MFSGFSRSAYKDVDQIVKYIISYVAENVDWWKYKCSLIRFFYPNIVVLTLAATAAY